MTSARLLTKSCAAVLLSSVALAQDNILVVIADDMGVDRLGIYGEHPNPGVTPNLDQLAARGLLFRNAWIHPGCTPSRASMLTGRLPSRHGLGAILTADTPLGLPLQEITIPEMLDIGTGSAYTSFAVGKWHIAGSTDDMLHPLRQGFHHHSGSKENIGDYEHWRKYVNGSSAITTTYATTDTTDDAITQIALSPEPWFGWLAYNAPHSPHHAPPTSLSSSFNLSGNPNLTPVEHTKAAIEAMDTEIGRLLRNIDSGVLSRTTIIFLGDNGTTSQATDAPFDPGQAKGTAYEGGVNVPFFVTGPHVAQPGSETAGLVMGVDLFATVADIAGVDLTPLGIEHDSVSFLSYLSTPNQPTLREYAFTENFTPNGFGPYVRRWIGFRGDRYKIVMLSQDVPVPGLMLSLFDLQADPFEQNNLLAGLGAVVEEFIDLRLKLLDLLASF
ncbi:MAG: sulfatase-like hydrolase/transferase [Planctomycetota bacterium]|nr:sulfatase-like hydrolase/transferase [Planctomycetota bacterium]